MLTKIAKGLLEFVNSKFSGTNCSCTKLQLNLRTFQIKHRLSQKRNQNRIGM